MDDTGKWFDTPKELPQLSPRAVAARLELLGDQRLGRRPCQGVTVVQPPIPERVFKYFTHAEHAERFLAGHIRLKTLEGCRHDEDASRADPGEGTMALNTGEVYGDGSDERVQAVAQRFGIGIPHTAKNIYFSNNLIIHPPEPDCWLFCTSHVDSEILQEKFGQFRVEIPDAIKFFYWVDIAMRRRCLVGHSELCAVQYRSRQYTEDEEPPSWSVRIKPDDFEAEAEIRMLWLPWPRRSGTIEQQVDLFVPKVTALLRPVE